MKLTELVLDHIEITKQTKEQSCRHNGGPADLSPMLLWVDELDKTSLAIVDAKGTVRDYMPKALELIAKQNPKIVIFICESLGMKLDSVDEMKKFGETHKSGDLEKLFARRGPLSGVEELIAFNALDTSTGEQVQGMAKFHYDDFGLPVFGETTVHTVEDKYLDESNVTSLFKQFYLYCLLKKARAN